MSPALHLSLLLSLSITTALLTTGCEKKAKVVKLDDIPPSEEYHADNDIAMTIRSLADAISVGEELDPTQYDFEGILTDGQGMPLYTDLHGNPGGWKVEIVSKDTAMISNMYLGDLLHDDLVNYIESNVSIQPHDSTEYVFQGGTVTIESVDAIAPNGLEGPMVRIILARDTTETHNHELL